MPARAPGFNHSDAPGKAEGPGKAGHPLRPVTELERGCEGLHFKWAILKEEACGPRGAEAGRALIPYASRAVRGEVIRSNELKLRKRKSKRRSIKAFPTVVLLAAGRLSSGEVPKAPLPEALRGPW